MKKALSKIMHWYGLFVALSILAGCAMAIQPGANGTLASALGHPLRASIASFAIGLATLTIIAVFMRVGLPNASQIGRAPWWGWIGGLLGAIMVTISLLIGPKMGATQFFAFVLSAQLGLALLLDHFGWFGYHTNPANPGRVAGVVFLILGVLMVNWFSSPIPPVKNLETADSVGLSSPVSASSAPEATQESLGKPAVETEISPEKG